MIFHLLFAIFFINFSYAQLTHESEVSSVTSGGNNRVETYLFRTNNQYIMKQNTYRLNGHYTYGEAGDKVSARDWDINTKYERSVLPNVAFYFGELVEGYRFQGIKARYNTDFGVKYSFEKSDVKNFFVELGYRYTVEDRYLELPTVFENKGRFYLEYNNQPQKAYSYRFWAEYVHNLTDSDDYIVTFEGSFTSIITSIFSLKVAYRGVYDDQPAVPGNKNYDYTYTTSLVAKF